MNIKTHCLYLIFFSLFLVGCKTNIQDNSSQDSKSLKENSNLTETGLYGQLCEGSGSYKFKTYPIDIENISAIVPMGRTQDSHVTPTDHQYILPKETISSSLVTDNKKKFDIKAPGDGYIIQVEIFKEPVEVEYRDQEYSDNYLVIFEHSCTFYSELIHIDTLKPEILSAIEFREPDSQHPFGIGRVPVKEGEVIGTVGSHSFDFYITDIEVDLKGFINPEHYSGHFQPWKTHVVDTFDYLEEPVRNSLLKKNLRTEKPLGGKIDYDIDGKLVGSWYFDWDPQNPYGQYWEKEISIVYDHLDPDQIRVSLGDFDGYPRAFGITGNSPDPADIGVKDKLVKYELVKYDYFDQNENRWDGLGYAEGLHAKNRTQIEGIVLFQLIDDHKLKVEVFPYANSTDINGFTKNAKIYER